MVPTYVIHASFLRERAEAIRTQLAEHGLAAEWITDYDPDGLTPETVAGHFMPADGLTSAQRSCAMKHIEAMRRIRDAGYRRALIVEDDAILCPDFASRLREVLAEADTRTDRFTVSLGVGNSQFTHSALLRQGQSLYENNRVRMAEAYLLGAGEAGLRLAWIEQNRLGQPIDLAYNAMDPALGIAILWAEPPLAEQGSLTGKYESTVSPKRRSRLRVWMQYRYHYWRRRYLLRWLRLR